MTHIYVRNLDGSTRDLTPGASLKANFAGWAGDDKAVARDKRHVALVKRRTMSDADIFFKAGVDLFGISNWIRTLENTPPWIEVDDRP